MVLYRATAMKFLILRRTGTSVLLRGFRLLNEDYTAVTLFDHINLQNNSKTRITRM